MFYEIALHEIALHKIVLRALVVPEMDESVRRIFLWAGSYPKALTTGMSDDQWGKDYGACTKYSRIDVGTTCESILVPR